MSAATATSCPPACTGATDLTSTSGTVQTDVLQVNGAPAVKCKICEKPVAMKDWGAHVAGKKHIVAGEKKGFSKEATAEEDRKVKEGIPSVIPTLKAMQENAVLATACGLTQHIGKRKKLQAEDDKSTWETLQREHSADAEAPDTLEGYITSTKTLACGFTQHTSLGEALCGDIPLSAAVPTSWVGSKAAFDIRKNGAHIEAFNVRKTWLKETVASSYLKHPPEMLLTLPSAVAEDTLSVVSKTQIDGLTFCYKMLLEKVEGKVKYTRGGAVRWLDSGFVFDYDTYSVRSRCGGFSYPFVVTGKGSVGMLARLRAFIGTDVVPEEALKVTEEDFQQVIADELFTEVVCGKVLGRLREAMSGCYGVCRAWRICNDKLESSFARTHDRLSKTAYCDVDWGFHGTREENILSIASDGFDPSKRRGQAYGAGEYFAVHPNTSVSYTGGGSYLFYCKLLIGTGQHSSYVTGCRYHVINTAVGTVMALPMYLIEFRKPLIANPVGVCQAWKKHLEGGEKVRKTSEVAMRPVYDTRETSVPLARMFGWFRVGCVGVKKVGDVVEIVTKLVDVKEVVVGEAVLGHCEVKVGVVNKVSGAKLASLRDKIYANLSLIVSIVVRGEKNATSPGRDPAWEQAPQNGTVQEIKTRLNVARVHTVKRFASRSHLQQYTSMIANFRAQFSHSSVEEQQSWLTTPHHAQLLEGTLTSEELSELQFSATAVFHEYKKSKIAVFCTRILLNGAEVGHPAAVLPLYGAFPKA